MPYIDTIDALKREAALRGNHFFDADALRFFSSRVHSSIYGGRFFVTSEHQRGVYLSSGWIPASPRLYTVRSFELYTGDTGRPCIDIDTDEEGFQGYETRAQAHAAARRLAAQLWTFDKEEVREITDAALTALAWSESFPVQVSEDGTVSLYDGTAPDADDYQPADSFGLDFSAKAIDTMAGEVRSFLALCAAAHLPVRSAGDLGQIGHDLVLTMNGHGAGFWDRGTGVLGIALSHWARSLGELHVYADDDMLEIER